MSKKIKNQWELTRDGVRVDWAESINQILYLFDSLSIIFHNGHYRHYKQSEAFMRTFAATQAKQNFCELLDALDSDDVSIVRNGREVAFVSSPKRQRTLLDVLEAKR
jgi:hypothetical protein